MKGEFYVTLAEKKCENCELLSRKYSEEDRGIFKKVWNNVYLVYGKDGKKRVMVKYIYQNDLEVTFHPRNSNFKHAIAMTNNAIMHLKMKNQLNVFKDKIGKKIEMGKLEKFNMDELEEVLQKPHRFC